MTKVRLLTLLALTIFATSCETTGEGVATGAAAGAALGAGAGTLVDPGAKGTGRIKNVVVGTAGGALLGAGAGYLIQRSASSKVDEAREQGRAEAQKNIETQAMDGGEPTLLPPKVEAHFVPDQVRGAVFVPAHFEYRIVQPARWSREAENGGAP